MFQAQDNLLQELRSHRFFDVFEYNALEKHWGCFLCNHPDRAPNFVQDRVPVIEGQLKEKKGGKLSIFKKWRSRYFTLSGAKLSFKDSVSLQIYRNNSWKANRKNAVMGSNPAKNQWFFVPKLTKNWPNLSIFSREIFFFSTKNQLKSLIF